MGVENFEKIINKLVKSPHGEAEKGKLIMSEKDKEKNITTTRIGSAIYSRDIHPEATAENPVYGGCELVKRELIKKLKNENSYE